MSEPRDQDPAHPPLRWIYRPGNQQRLHHRRGLAGVHQPRVRHWLRPVHPEDRLVVRHISKALIILAITAAALTGCESKTATITVDPGLGGKFPAVDCHAVIPNPDYPLPTPTPAKP